MYEVSICNTPLLIHLKHNFGQVLAHASTCSVQKIKNKIIFLCYCTVFTTYQSTSSRNSPKQITSRMQPLPAGIVHLSVWHAEEPQHKIADENVLQDQNSNRSKKKYCFLPQSKFTCDDRLIISLRNQGTPVRERIERMVRNVISTTSLRSFVSNN
jgi:hypothetical protein